MGIPFRRWSVARAAAAARSASEARTPRRSHVARVALAAFAAVATLSSCGGDTPPPVRDTVLISPATVPNSLEVATETAAWDSAYGDVLIVNDSSSRVAEVVYPEYTENVALEGVAFDLRRANAVRVELFGLGGAAGVATMRATHVPDSSCARWPSATVAGETPASSLWTVGVVAGRATPISLVAIDALSRADSARFAADIARLAGALPNDTIGALRGVPFVVRSAWRFRPVPGRDGLAAIVARRLNLEASPLEERLLIVAERDSGVTTPYAVMWFDRASGLEEDVMASDVLAAVNLGRTPALFVSRDGSEGGAYWLLERGAAGPWRVRWRSAQVSC